MRAHESVASPGDRPGGAVEHLPLACDVAAIPAGEREAHFAAIAWLFAAARERK